jgi:hypothetical protein
MIMGKDIRVLRGVTSTYNFDGAVHLIVDDNRINDAWRVTKFVIAPQDPANSSAGARDCIGVLATHVDAIPEPTGNNVWWNWADRRQFAWTALSMDGDTQLDLQFDLIDPTHVIVRDLYVAITAQSAFSATKFSYYIEIERVELSDVQAVMAIIQEESQSA